MTGPWIALIAIAGTLLLLLTVVLLAPLRLRVVLRQKEVSLTVSLLFFRKTLLSISDKPEKPVELKDAAKCPTSLLIVRKEERRWRRLLRQREKNRLKKWQREEEKRLSPKLNIPERLELIRNVLRRTGTITNGRATVRVDEMHVVVATGDAASTAILYGTVVQSAAFFMQWIDGQFARVRRKEGAMTVTPDYTAKRSSVNVDVCVYARTITALPGIARIAAVGREEARNIRRRARRRLRRRRKTAPPERSAPASPTTP